MPFVVTVFIDHITENFGLLFGADLFCSHKVEIVRCLL